MKKDNLRKTLIEGLLMAAVIAVIPDLAWADLSNAANTSQTSVFGPILQIVSYASYAMGGVLVMSGAVGLKNHAENATTTPLAKPLTKVVSGASLLALPYLMGLANSTAHGTFGGQANFTGWTF